MTASSLYTDDAGEEQSSPLSAILYPPTKFKPQPFDPSPCRRDDCALVAEAMKLQPDRQSMTIAAARQIVAGQKDRERRAVLADKAKKRYHAKKASASRADASRKPARKAG